MLARPDSHAKKVGRAVLTERAQGGRSFLLIDRRLAEIGALIRARHGASLPFTDDVDLYLMPVADALVAHARLAGKPTTGAEAEPTARIVAERLRLWCPNMPPAEAADIAAAALAEPRRWSAADIGDQLAITPAEREDLGIRTMRPAGHRGRKWTAVKRERERQRAAERRAASGAKNRAEAKAALEEEIAASGLSRRTFFRRRAQHAQHDGTGTSALYPLHISDFRVPFVASKGETAAEQARRLGVHRSTVLRRRRREAATATSPDTMSTGPPGARGRARPDLQSTLGTAP